jgi:hypothetical protein
MKEFVKRKIARLIKRRLIPIVIVRIAEFILRKAGVKSGNPVVFEGAADVVVWKI